MKVNNEKDVLPDFYNITLEIHKNDPKGIDMLVTRIYYILVCGSYQ
jgi:hypothetical protein